VSGKRDREYCGHNFDKFKYIVINFLQGILRSNAKLLTQPKSDSPNQCRYITLRIRYRARTTVASLETETPEFIPLWPPNSQDLNPVDYSLYSVWGILQKKVYKTRMTDLDDLKHRIRTEWTKLDHAVIAAAVDRWRCHASLSVRQGRRRSVPGLLLIFFDIVFATITATFLTVVDQSNSFTLIDRSRLTAVVSNRIVGLNMWNSLPDYVVIRYDTIVYLTYSKKLTGSQLSLPHGINKKIKCETKNKMMSVIDPVQSREAVQ